MTEVTIEYGTIEPIVYKRGSVVQKLEDFHAWQYRSMIWKYGEAEATERFWWQWHKRKESATA